MKTLNMGNNYSALETVTAIKPICTNKLCYKVHGGICDLVLMPQ